MTTTAPPMVAFSFRYEPYQHPQLDRNISYDHRNHRPQQSHRTENFIPTQNNHRSDGFYRNEFLGRPHLSTSTPSIGNSRGKVKSKAHI